MQFAVGGHGTASEVLFVFFGRSVGSVSLLADTCDVADVVLVGGGVFTIWALVV